MMDLPQWIMLTAERANCPKCGWRFQRKNIIAVGVADRKAHGKFGAACCVFVRLMCPECGKSHVIDVHYQTLRQFATSVLRGYEREREQRTVDGASKPATPARGDPSRAASGTPGPAVAPSVRPGTPSAPIGDREVVRAKKALARIAFRPGAVSWERFLRRLGVR